LKWAVFDPLCLLRDSFEVLGNPNTFYPVLGLVRTSRNMAPTTITIMPMRITIIGKGTAGSIRPFSSVNARGAIEDGMIMFVVLSWSMKLSLFTCSNRSY
jgi:hypothetical protein